MTGRRKGAKAPAAKSAAKPMAPAAATPAPAVERWVKREVFEIQVRKRETTGYSFEGENLPTPAEQHAAALDELFARVETLEKAGRVPHVAASSYSGKLTLYWKELVAEAPAQTRERTS